MDPTPTLPHGTGGRGPKVNSITPGGRVRVGARSDAHDVDLEIVEVSVLRIDRGAVGTCRRGDPCVPHLHDGHRGQVGEPLRRQVSSLLAGR